MRKKQKFEEFDSNSDDSNFFGRKLRSKNRKNARFTTEMVDFNKTNDDKHYDVNELTDECPSEIIDEFSDAGDDNLNDPDYNQRNCIKYDCKRKSPQCMSKLFIRQLDYESYKYLELPPSASDLLLRSQGIWSAVGVYEVLYQFSNVLRLSPFRFENFCAALFVKENTKLLAECHMSLLKCILKEDEQSGVVLTTKDCKDSVSISFYCLDDMTWFEAICMYLESISKKDVIRFHNVRNYYCLSVEQKLTLLQTLIDLFLCTNMARDVLFKENELVHEEHCRSCHKKFNINRRGNLLCCESCPAMYHLACIDPPLDTIPSGDWYCLACHKHKMAEIEDAKCTCMRNQLVTGRREPLGYDRHGRKYWHSCRRIFVEDDNELLTYYSTESQFEELLSKFDVERHERDLFESFEMCRDDIIGDMKVTDSLTEKFKDSRKTCLSQDDEKVNMRKTNQVNVVFDEGLPVSKTDTNHKANASKVAQNSQGVSNPWSSEPFFKLGMEGSFRNYSNVYSTEILALSRLQQVEEREKKRHLSYKFSLTNVAEFNWICGKNVGRLGVNGGHEAMLEILRRSIINLQESIPRPFMHANWILHSSKWLKAISKCTTAREFSLVLMIFEACIRPMVFNSVWHQALGHSTLQRTTSMEVEEGKKREKEVRSSLKEELSLNERVKYSLGVRHSVWKQRGEEYRITGQHSWYWVSPVRSLKSLKKVEPSCSQLQGNNDYPDLNGTYNESALHNNERFDVKQCIKLKPLESLSPAVKFLNGLLKIRLQMEEGITALLKRLKETPDRVCKVQHLVTSQNDSSTISENGHNNHDIAAHNLNADNKVIFDKLKKEAKNDEVNVANNQSSMSLNEVVIKIEEALKANSFTNDLAEILGTVHSSKARVSLKKLLPSRRSKNMNGGLPMAHYFEVRKQKKRTSIYVLDKEKLGRLARKSGTIEVPGFIYSSSGSFCPNVDKAINEIYPEMSRFLGCPRANFQTAWRYRTRMASNLSCLALQLRVLHCCIRWEDLYAPYPSDGILVIDGAEQGMDDITTYEMLDKRIIPSRIDPVSYKVEYLVRKKVIPKESCQPLPPSSGERSTQRTGLRERRILEPTISEELISEEDMELWQIKYFADMNDKVFDNKTPSDKKLQRVSSSTPSLARSASRPQTPTCTANQTPSVPKASSQAQTKHKASLPGRSTSSAMASSSKLSIEDELKRKRMEMQQKRFESTTSPLSQSFFKTQNARGALHGRELPIKILQQQSDESVQSKSGLCVNELLKHISVVKGPDGKLEVLGLKEGQEAIHLPGGRIKIILSPLHCSNQSPDVKTSSNDNIEQPILKKNKPEQHEKMELSNINTSQISDSMFNRAGSHKCNKAILFHKSSSIENDSGEMKTTGLQERDIEHSNVDLSEQAILAGLKKVLTSDAKFQSKDYKLNDDKDEGLLFINSIANGVSTPEKLPKYEPTSDNGANINIPKIGKTGKQFSSGVELPCKRSPKIKSFTPFLPASSQPPQNDSECQPVEMASQVSSVNVITRKMISFEVPHDGKTMKPSIDADKGFDELSKQAKKRKRDSTEELLGPKKVMKFEKILNGDSSGKEEDAKLHCICQTPYDNTKFYIGCNNCGSWYHGGCVGITPEAAALKDKYICESCRQLPSNQLHCTCRTPYDETKFYIGCDECFGWFHGECVGILASEAQSLDSFKCQSCKSKSMKLEEPAMKEEHNLKLLQLLKELKDLPISQAFLDDSIQKNKRGFNFIEEKLLIRSYKKLEEFIEDFEGFFSDLRYYSPKQSIDYKNANKLQSMFLSKLIKLRKRL